VAKLAKAVEVWGKVVNNFTVVMEVSGEAGGGGK
jgi:hypothetical protein